MIRAYLILATIILSFLPRLGANGPGFQFSENKSSIVIPIHISQNLIIVPVRINGSPPLNFILDTGVRTTILSEPALIGSLGLNLEETVIVLGLGGEGIVEAARDNHVRLELAGLVGHNMNLIILPDGVFSFSEMFGFPVYGIIGYDLFRDFPVEINYSGSFIRIFRNSDYRISRRSTVVPLQIVNEKPYASVEIAGQNNDTLRTQLLVDLGASHPVFLSKEHQGLSEKVIEGLLGIGISGPLLGSVGRLKHLSIGGVSAGAPVVAYPYWQFFTVMGEQIPWQGIIGGGLLKRFDLIIDYGSERMVMRRNFRHRKPYGFNMSGLELKAGGSDFREFTVHFVRQGSPAYEAGIMPGDRLLKINRRPDSEISLHQIQEELNGPARKIIRMELERNGETLHRRIRLRHDI